MVLGSAHEEFHRIAHFVADGTDDVLRHFLGIVVHAYDTVAFAEMKDRGLGPADIIGNPLAQESFFDEMLAVRVGDFAELDFVVHFY